MRKVEEYKQNAKHCRALAALVTRPEDKVTLEEIAEAWEKSQRSVSAIYTRLTNSFLSLRVSARTMTLKELDLSDDRLRDNRCVTTVA
jgi:hypothetical protein